MRVEKSENLIPDLLSLYYVYLTIQFKFRNYWLTIGNREDEIDGIDPCFTKIGKIRTIMERLENPLSNIRHKARLGLARQFTADSQALIRAMSEALEKYNAETWVYRNMTQKAEVLKSIIDL